MRRASTYWCGASPVAARKLRAKWKALRPATAARSARVSVSSSRASTASATRARVRGSSGAGGSGGSRYWRASTRRTSRCASVLASMSESSARPTTARRSRCAAPSSAASRRKHRCPRRAERRLELEARDPRRVGVGARQREVGIDLQRVAVLGHAAQHRGLGPDHVAGARLDAEGVHAAAVAELDRVVGREDHLEAVRLRHRLRPRTAAARRIRRGAPARSAPRGARR